jgi:hypothetical protein
MRLLKYICSTYCNLESEVLLNITKVGMGTRSKFYFFVVSIVRVKTILRVNHIIIMNNQALTKEEDIIKFSKS